MSASKIPWRYTNFDDNDCFYLKNAPEKRATGREDDFVRSYALSFARQCAVDETLFLPQILEACHDVGLKTIPFEADLLTSHFRRQ